MIAYSWDPNPDTQNPESQNLNRSEARSENSDSCVDGGVFKIINLYEMCDTTTQYNTMENAKHPDVRILGTLLLRAH